MATEPRVAGPVVKWAGGKTRLLHEILPLVPREVGTYAEPFAGGLAVYFALAEEVRLGKRRVGRAVLTDANPELVVLYTVVRDDVEALIRRVSSADYAGGNDERRYYEVRAAVPSTLDHVERAARVLYLNHTCFNGLWREGPRGFNVPFAGYKNPRVADPEGLRLASAAMNLVPAEVHCRDFFATCYALAPGDFAFLDPPYDPASETSSFAGYTRGGFGPDEQCRVAGAMHDFEDRRVAAVLTNHDTPRTRALFARFRTRAVSAPRSIAANGSRADAREIIVATSAALGER